MATATDKLTQKSQDLLGEPVQIAFRIVPGPVKGLNNPLFGQSLAQLAFFIPNLAKGVGKKIFGFFKESVSGGGEAGAVALMGDGSYRLLETDPLFSTYPRATLRAFPEDATLKLDTKTFADKLQAEFMLDDYVAVINGVDLKALMKQVEAGNIEKPELQAFLPTFKSYMTSALASHEIEGKDVVRAWTGVQR